jgi:hypothetical protein
MFALRDPLVAFAKVHHGAGISAESDLTVGGSKHSQQIC